MVHRSGCPGSGAMTGIASSSRCYVCRGLAQCRRSVMAGGTSAWGDSRVAERRGDPGRRPVTAVAGLGCRDVVSSLAASGATVVTSCTSARRHPGVTERRGDPGGGPMTSVAGGCGGNVRRWLTGCPCAVMAGGASPRHHASVIVSRRREKPVCCARSVAAITRGGRRDVGSRLPASLYTIVTGHAGSRHDTCMFKDRARPGHGAVATIARHGCGNVRGRLALGDTLVMAPGACSGRHAVVGKVGRLPVCRSVATIAIGGRG